MTILDEAFAPSAAELGRGRGAAAAHETAHETAHEAADGATTDDGGVVDKPSYDRAGRLLA